MSQSRNLADDIHSNDRTRSSAQLTSMMRKGRSFSGRERNCCFLNTLSDADANGRFANVAAASGLDFADDGRAIGSLDWDLDGDLDVWVTNRNAPRLRLMRNDTQHQNRYVAFRLIGNGTTVNRDAIGTRMEIVTQDEPNTVRAKTLRAGDAFLSQSSKWLHFGLGKHGSIKSVRVRWPDGSVEEFGPVTANQRYQIKQSSGQIESWEPPARNLAIYPWTPTLPERSSAARVPLVFPVRVPNMSYHDFAGRDHDLSIGKRPLLLNLWASWCSPCLAELQELKQRHEEFNEAGLDVVALSVDRLSIGQSGEGTQAHSNADERFVSELSAPFVMGRAPEQVVDTIQFLHDLVIHSRQTLPIPTSILLDGDGRLIAIYKGDVSPEAVFVDLKRSKATFVERKTNAAMIDGTAIRHSLLDNVAQRTHAYTLFQAGFAMRRADRVQEAISYFSDAVAVAPESVTAHLYLGDALVEGKRYHDAILQYQLVLRMNPCFRGVHVKLANALQAIDQIDEAAEHYKQSLRLVPDDADVHSELGKLFVRRKRYSDALLHFEKAARMRPDSVVTHVNFGNVLKITGRYKEAATEYEAALRIDPDSAETHNNLGAALQAQDRFDEAISHYRVALELDPQLAVVHRNWGRALQMKGTFEEAVTHFQAAVRIKSDFAQAYYELGRTQLLLNRVNQAVENLERVLRLTPSDGAAHREMGRVLIILGRLDEGISHYRTSLQLRPSDIETLNNLAWLLATTEDDRVRDGQNAFMLAERAAQLTSNEDPLVLDTLAAAYAEVGDFEKAIRWQTRAIELSPSNQKDGRARLERYRSGSPFRELRSEKTSPADDTSAAER
ncbi:MAG: tetratricopeptide repeat protein [Planctomycetales bacterium]|nr:tetratricopeptide repeat protein [Planctomycetales bacterium]